MFPCLFCYFLLCAIFLLPFHSLYLPDLLFFLIKLYLFSFPILITFPELSLFFVYWQTFHCLFFFLPWFFPFLFSDAVTLSKAVFTVSLFSNPPLLSSAPFFNSPKLFLSFWLLPSFSTVFLSDFLSPLHFPKLLFRFSLQFPLLSLVQHLQYFSLTLFVLSTYSCMIRPSHFYSSSNFRPF